MTHDSRIDNQPEDRTSGGGTWRAWQGTPHAQKMLCDECEYYGSAHITRSTTITGYRKVSYIVHYSYIMTKALSSGTVVDCCIGILPPRWGPPGSYDI